MSVDKFLEEPGSPVKRGHRGLRVSETGTTLIELMIAMGLLMVIAAVALGSITLAENQQANTYARTVSISQAQLIAEAVTRAIRNAENVTVLTDTPIIEASPYELYFYQQSYSNPVNNRISIIWLAGGSLGVSDSAPPPKFGTDPGCSLSFPCTVEESIYTPPKNSSYPESYLAAGLTLFESKNLGTGIVFSNSSPTTTTNSCGSAIFTTGGSVSVSVVGGSGPGIFQFYDACLNSTASLQSLQTIGVTLQAQYQSGKPLVSVTNYVQIRNLGSGS